MLADLPWPQREWWSDRDRIYFLSEFVDDHEWPPSGDLFWEDTVDAYALMLWGGQKNSAGTGWEDIVAPGWRYLTSLSECPRSLRPGRSSVLRDRIRRENAWLV